MITDPLEGIGRYAVEIIRYMAMAHPEAGFHLIFDRSVPRYSLGDNVFYHRTGWPARHPWLWYWWFEYSFRRKAEQQKATVIFSPESYMCLSTRIPTVVTCHDLAYLHYPQFNKKSHLSYLQKYFPAFHRAASHTIAVSHFTKDDLINQYNIKADDISVLYHGISKDFKPWSQDKIDSFRKNNDLHQPYFLYVGAIHPRKNVIRLIQAFNLFKEEHGSDHQLVLAGRMAWQYNDVISAITSSSYCRDIRHKGYFKGDLAGLINGAEALCYVSLFEGFGLPVLEAMACGTAVICSADSAMSEITDGAALLADPTDARDIADAMSAVTLDYEKKHQYISAGLKRILKFSWEKSAEETYNILSDINTANELPSEQ